MGKCGESIVYIHDPFLVASQRVCSQNLGLANNRRSAPSPAFHRRNGDHDASAGFPTKLGSRLLLAAGIHGQVSVGGCDAPQMRAVDRLITNHAERTSTYGPRPCSLLSRQQAKTENGGSSLFLVTAVFV
jgi:hypothetical protein